MCGAPPSAPHPCERGNEKPRRATRMGLPKKRRRNHCNHDCQSHRARERVRPRDDEQRPRTHTHTQSIKLHRLVTGKTWAADAKATSSHHAGTLSKIRFVRLRADPARQPRDGVKLTSPITTALLGLGSPRCASATLCNSTANRRICEFWMSNL